MTTTDRIASSGGSRDEHTGVPRLGGDELFVPASHVLVIDRHVSHPAFRLWCVLHRLWFLREPPTMEVLQALMGSHTTAKASPNPVWQPATRRSIERWLTELEHAGWLVWVRREETTRRYHLRTSARSAPDTAILTELRTLLNSGKATLAEVQALVHGAAAASNATTAESHATTGESQPPLEPSASGGDDGGGPTTTERYLIRQGFSVKAAREFRTLDWATVQADFERRRELGQGIGAIVTTWRVDPPQAESPHVVLPHAQEAADAKAQALTLAPPDASDLEIQYLALDLEDGLPPTVALAHLQARRAGAGGAP
ncbi:hypothetical protein [Candidatus Viridilinea mediisalina]|uniref:Uncharacterized protein n=1 Tax=Candidatus Viridilinea mediisalina TaxID=2024553 RepID=A0A2A6RPJ6_9CHLR|nr:hypothetical protein [Candidatus Viridilinea mediisalina]PDW05024.1 hypothetical protein CJ255_00080 [Candidatus Viridilinea mediisalina]